MSCSGLRLSYDVARMLDVKVWPAVVVDIALATCVVTIMSAFLFAPVIGMNVMASCGCGSTCFLITCVIKSVSELS